MGSGTSKFFRAFLRNLGLLVVLGGGLFILYPDVARQVFELYGALFGPIAILFVVVAALPRKRRR